MSAARVAVWLALSFACGLAAVAAADTPQPPPPHIVLVVADDLGWNDVPFTRTNTCDIHTPTLSKLAKQVSLK